MKPTLAGVHHITPMLSLDCAYDPQAVVAWVQSVGCAVVAEPKLDGVAASVRYVDGNLESVATRGDGITGRDITDRAERLMPSLINCRGVCEVRGEFVIPRHLWQFGWTQADARNRVAHLTTCRDSTWLGAEGAEFVAYDVAGDLDSVPMAFAQYNSDCHPCDGIVFKVVSRSDRERLGATKRAPRWAIAYKGEASALRGLRGLEDIPIPNV